MQDIDYELGDIVKWRGHKSSTDYNYGMIIREPQVVTGGLYSFSEHLADLADISADTFTMTNPLIALTIFSFAEQRVVTLYRNPEDVPLFIEKVRFSEKSP